MNKAVFSEQRYRQLLSTSQSNARRRLSSSFATSDMEATKTRQTSLTSSYRESSPGEVEIESLQKSMDSVFLETVTEVASSVSGATNVKLQRINPLTARVRSQSLVVGGGEPLSLAGHTHTGLISESVGGSPLVTRHMSRTGSGAFTHTHTVNTCTVQLLSHNYYHELIHNLMLSMCEHYALILCPSLNPLSC